MFEFKQGENKEVLSNRSVQGSEEGEEQEESMRHIEVHDEKFNLTCEDIVLAIVDYTLRKEEPIILSIDKEVHCINSLSLRLAPNEASDYMKRSHMAHNVMNFFEGDLTSKFKLIQSMRRKKFYS